MTRLTAAGPAAALVAGYGVLATLGEYLLLGGSTASAACALAGLLGSIAALLGRAAGATLIGGAMIGQAALAPHAGVAAVMTTAVLLAVLLAAAESAASERWRLGARALARFPGVPVGVGVALAGGSIGAAAAVRDSGASAALFAVVAVVAAAGASAVAFVRQRPAGRRD